jgi:hypothetical protein
VSGWIPVGGVGQGKTDHIHQQDPQQGDAPYDIERLDSLCGSYRFHSCKYNDQFEASESLNIEPIRLNCILLTIQHPANGIPEKH